MSKIAAPKFLVEKFSLFLSASAGEVQRGGGASVGRGEEGGGPVPEVVCEAGSGGDEAGGG